MKSSLWLCLMLTLLTVLPRQGSASDVEEALSLARSGKNKADRSLGWAAIRRLIQDKQGTFTERDITAIERAALNTSTLEALKTVESLYRAERQLAWDRIELKGLPRTIDKKDELTVFVIAAIAIYKAKHAAPEGEHNLQVKFELNEKDNQSLQFVYDSLAAPNEEIEIPRSVDDLEGSSYNCLFFLVRRQPKKVDTAQKKLELVQALKCATGFGDKGVLELVRIANAERAIKLLDQADLGVDLETLLSSVDTTSQDGDLSLEKAKTLFPEFSTVTTPDLSRVAVYDKLSQGAPAVVALPLQEARLRYREQDIGPVQLSSYPLKDGYPRRLDVKTGVATPETLLEQGEGQHIFEFSGSNNSMGCVFHTNVATEAANDVHQLATLRFGVKSDAYVKKGGDAKTLQFWEGASYQPSAEGNWLAVRWRAESKAPIADSFEKTVLSHTDQMRDEEGKAFIKSSLEHAQKQLGAEGLNREVAKYVERYQRGERANSALLKEQGTQFPEIGFGLFKVMESFFQDVSYTKGAAGQIKCVLGCVNRAAQASENSDWLFFTRIPKYKGPVIFETVFSPLVTHRIEFDALHGRGGLSNQYFELLDLSNAAASRFPAISPFEIGRIPEKEESHPLLVYVAALQTYLGTPPNEKEPNVELAALTRLAEVISLQQLSLLPEESKIIAQRQTFLASAIPQIAASVHANYGKLLENQIQLLAFSSLSSSKSRKELASATSKYETLSQDERVALLSQVTKLSGAERESVSKDIEAFESALIGAQEMMAEFDSELKERLRISCEVLKKLQYKGSSLLPPLSSKKEVLDLCYGL